MQEKEEKIGEMEVRMKEMEERGRGRQASVATTKTSSSN